MKWGRPDEKESMKEIPLEGETSIRPRKKELDSEDKAKIRVLKEVKEDLFNLGFKVIKNEETKLFAHLILDGIKRGISVIDNKLEELKDFVIKYSKEGVADLKDWYWTTHSSYIYFAREKKDIANNDLLEFHSVKVYNNSKENSIILDELDKQKEGATIPETITFEVMFTTEAYKDNPKTVKAEFDTRKFTVMKKMEDLYE